MDLQRRFRIHPAIGICRVGNAAADTFFIGPETPGSNWKASPPGSKVPPFKVPDTQGKPARVKPQAARFRIWEYRQVDGKWSPHREVTLGDPEIDRVEWVVHLANRKASFFGFEGDAGETRPAARRRNEGIPATQLDIDPGLRRISAASPGGNSTRAVFSPGTSDQPDQELWPVRKNGEAAGEKVIDYLGELRMDGAGRLIVIGGRGRAASDLSPPATIGHYANNDHWWDDVSDGPVTATITLNDSEAGGSGITVAAEGAWVLVGPPDFAPHTGNVVTLYDLLYDMVARRMALPADEAVFDDQLRRLRQLNEELFVQGRQELSDYVVSFHEDVYPLLRRILGMRWVFPGEFHRFDSFPGWENLADPGPDGAEARRFVFIRLRPPRGFGPAPASRNMPRLFGDGYGDPNHPDSFLTVTPTQYLILKRWREGFFERPSTRQPPADDSSVTPYGLDRAALEHCVGGSFFPGIEVGWQIRASSLYSAPFRINHEASSAHLGDAGSLVRPGHFTRQMAVPWHADFQACSNELQTGWWPGQRPDSVYPNEETAKGGSGAGEVEWHRPSSAWPANPGDPARPSRSEMVEHWNELGFVVSKKIPVDESREPAEIFFEVERETTVPFQ